MNTKILMIYMTLIMLFSGVAVSLAGYDMYLKSHFRTAGTCDYCKGNIYHESRNVLGRLYHPWCIKKV